MKRRLIVLSMLVLAGCASVPKEQCRFLYTDHRYDRDGLKLVPLCECTRKMGSDSIRSVRTCRTSDNRVMVLALGRPRPH